MPTKLFLSLLLLLPLAIALGAGLRPIAPTPSEVVRTGEVRLLPGKLDEIPVFNSNSPEWVKTEGILLSTFPPDGKQKPAAHLNYGFQGRFDLFAHHFSHTPKDLQTLYLGAILHNPGKKAVTVQVLAAASHLMSDAPFIVLPPYVDNSDGTIAAGPGDRAVSDVLRGRRQSNFPAKLIIPPGESRLLLNFPIPVKGLEKPVNGRSTLMRLQSNGKVYAATLAMWAKKNSDGSDRAPTLTEWQNLLVNGDVAQPRDKTPTPPDQLRGQLIYGRVAGVAQGSQWQASLTDQSSRTQLTIPEPGATFSYVLATVSKGTLGTAQVQAGKMLVRYPDTAYSAHGNYGVAYNLSLPLYNPTNQSQSISLTLETPIKEEQLSQGGLRFRQPPLNFPFFRGTVRLRYQDEQGKSKTRYVHLWHRVGQVLEPLETFALPAKGSQLVQVELIYPPDSTPPQVLTVKTLEKALE